jgi:hypothetical protein
VVKLAFAVGVSFLLQQQPQTALGRIEGTVLSPGSTEPISGARVSVIRINAATGATIETAGVVDSSGFFSSPTAPFPRGPSLAPGGAPTSALPLPIPPVITGRDGRFSVLNLEDGAYRVSVALNGYVRQEYGQRLLSGQGIPLTLSRGETLNPQELALRLKSFQRGQSEAVPREDGRRAVKASMRVNETMRRETRFSELSALSVSSVVV